MAVHKPKAPATRPTHAPHEVQPPTAGRLVERCLYSLGQPNHSRTEVRGTGEQAITEEVNVEVDMRLLHDTANKASLDMDTLVRGLQGMANVLKQGNTISPHSLDVRRAKNFIEAYQEHFQLTDSMRRAQDIIQQLGA